MTAHVVAAATAPQGNDLHPKINNQFAKEACHWWPSTENRVAGGEINGGARVKTQKSSGSAALALLRQEASAREAIFSGRAHPSVNFSVELCYDCGGVEIFYPRPGRASSRST